MKYTEFESIISPERMRKYNVACGGNKAKAMTLYRHNLRLSGRKLMGIFPNKPKSTQSHKFDNTYVFGELDYINKLRNRIAHHEPICFSKNPVSIDTKYIHNRYNRIMELFRWMDIDGASLLYGLGHIDNACNQIDALLK